MVQSKPCSQRAPKLPGLGSLGWASHSAHRLGTMVREITAEMTMVTASVTANSRNSRPTTSPMNSSGISTASSDTVSEMMVKPISPAPLNAASRAE